VRRCVALYIFIHGSIYSLVMVPDTKLSMDTALTFMIYKHMSYVFPFEHIHTFVHVPSVSRDVSETA
jgi:hypothetical protein